LTYINHITGIGESIGLLATKQERLFLPAKLIIRGAVIMPYVNIRITNEGVTPEKKELLIKGATQLLMDVLNKDPNTTFVVVDEVDTDNWGIAGETITARRKKGL
jgi:4-oxalocrotonate tautomerase family enzyme